MKQALSFIFFSYGLSVVLGHALQIYATVNDGNNDLSDSEIFNSLGLALYGYSFGGIWLFEGQKDYKKQQQPAGCSGDGGPLGSEEDTRFLFQQHLGERRTLPPATARSNS